MSRIRSVLGRIAPTAIARSGLRRLTVTPAAGRTGLVLTGGSARRILVTSPSPQSHTLTGVILEFGSSPTAPRPSLTQSRVLFPATGSGSGTGVETGVGAIISDIQVVAQITD